jgi:hypothetical protein
MNRALFRGSLLVACAVLATSCGGNSSLSPTAPSRNSNGGQPGAVIVGQVNSVAAGVTVGSTAGAFASTGTFGAADTPGATSITVKVIGTDISTTTSGQGQFTLTGVPPGDVRLEFTGRGSSAIISISGVKVDDEIRISVTLNGSNARVDSERRNNRNDSTREDQAEVKGAVSGLTGTCPKVSFTVEGAKVTTSETTQFEDVKCADIKNGMVLEIKGPRQSDGSIAATKVEDDD